jgi:predicted kinase
MPKIIILVGLPASSKSTWAIEQVEKSNGKIVRVNRDSLRTMIHADKWSNTNEAFTMAVRDKIITEAIRVGKTVIVDDTNLSDNVVDNLRALARQLGAEVEINDSFLKVPLEECIRRDAKREKPVGKDVILKMYNQFLRKEYKYQEGLPECVQLDADGTLCLFDGNPYDRDFSKDRPNTILLKNLIYPAVQDGLPIIILSGRNSKFREVTEKWIFDNTSLATCHYQLYMRDEKDNRPDYVVKKEMWDKYIKDKYNVRFVADDRGQVCRLWRSMGLFVFDVNQEGREF